MADGVTGGLDGGREHGARGAPEIAAELDRLIKDAEARGHETLAYLIRMAAYEAQRLAGERGIAR